ncbi:MAG: multiheme c-type cytochrome [Myxococcota bacterium]
MWWLALACRGDPAPPTETGTAPEPDPVELTDPLSMPAEPTVDPGAFQLAEDCGSCHAGHYREWRTSMHAYAMVDPVFQALVERRQADRDGLEDRFCVQCHSAIGTRGGEIVPGFAFEELSPITMEGVTCEACHRSGGELARDYNSGHVLDPQGPLWGPSGVSVAIHPTAASDLLRTSDFCGGCHDVIEASGLDLERPFREWQESPSAQVGQTCQDCHMPPVRRSPADGLPERTLRAHTFVGVEVPLLEGFLTPDEEIGVRARAAALLDTAVAIRLDGPTEVPRGRTFDLNVTVENRIAGHNLPTGSTFIRQLWVELVARDAEGTVQYATGTLDGNGDLRDHWSALDPYGDPDLISLASGFVDASGAPTLFPWTATEHTSNALSPRYERTWTLFVPTEAAVGETLTVEARLRFRAMPPHLLRTLGLDTLTGRLEVHDLATTTATVTLVE